MNQRNTKHKSSAVLNASPWILGTACLLLLLVLAIFAVNNFQREKGLIVGTLEQKGLTLVRFIHSTVREAVWQNLRSSSSWQGWDVHMREALALGLEQPGVKGVVVVDPSGNIVLNAGESEPGEEVISAGELSLVTELVQREKSAWVSGRVADGRDPGETFVVAARYQPPMSRQGRQPRNSMHGRLSHRLEFSRIQEEMKNVQELKLIFLVRLDMTQFDAPLQRQFLQILLQLIVIVLVGIGGALSFFTLRGLKGTERSLGNVRAFSDSMISSLPVGLLATDSEGRIQVCNGVTRTILEMSETELVGKKAELVLPSSLAGMLQGPLAVDDEEYAREVSLDCSGQRVKYLQLVSKRVVDQLGGFSGEVLVIRDLSEIRALEKELQRSERLAALGKMAAGVAHEIRNPLSSIKGLALLLKTHFIAGSTESEHADTLVKEVDRLNRSVGELLDFAKPGQLKRVEVAAEELVTRTMDLVELDAKSYDIHIAYTPPGVRLLIVADPDKLSQVVLNLLLNSIQALSGQDTITPGMISVGLQKVAGYLEIAVTDNGPGIDPEVLKKVFDPYFTTKNDGTGLGLALSLKIVEEHGGKMEITSTPGEATEVKVFLPMA